MADLSPVFGERSVVVSLLSAAHNDSSPSALLLTPFLAQRRLLHVLLLPLTG